MHTYIYTCIHTCIHTYIRMYVHTCYINLYTYLYILGYAIAQWLSLRLQMLGVAMVAGVSFIAVLEHHFDSVNPGKYNLYICILYNYYL